jgi:hypothetical protein
MQINQSGRIERTQKPPPILPTARSMQMMDIVMLGLGFVFFALTVGYAIACDHL